VPIFRLAWAHYRNNNVLRAIEKLREALTIDPNNPEILNRLSEVLIRLNKDENIEEAQKILEDVLRDDPNNGDAYFNLGKIHRK
jgi:cytochrome c-type biogenesis protein CcmH/NrfG